MGRRFLLILLLLAALAGSAAAGNGPSDPKQRHNPTDQARAAAVRIRHDDLGAGDWRVEPTTSGNEQLGGCRNPKMSDLVQTGLAKDPNFSRNGSYVGSEGEVWATLGDATKSWNRSVHFPLGTCLLRELKHSFAKSPGLTLTVLSSGPVPLPKLAPRTFSYRLSFRVKGPGGSVAGRMTIYAFAHGRVDGSLLVVSLGKPLQPIPLSFERRLAGLLAHRVSG
jgi:hypothetical protein